MYIHVILNLNQEKKRLGNKFTDILKNLNGVNELNVHNFGGALEVCTHPLT